MDPGHELINCEGPDLGASTPDRGLLALGLAVLTSLAIHGGVFLLIPVENDRGVAQHGQGGITISLGPAGREAGGEVAAAQETADVVSEVTAREPATIETSEATEMLEAETLSVPPEADAVTDAQVLAVSDIQVSEVDAVEVEVSDVETEEVALSERPPHQLDETTFTAKVVPPPLPKRRPQMQKKAAVQEQQKAETAAEPAKSVQPEEATPLEQPGQARRDVAEGDSETRTTNELAGQGGRSGQSGLSEDGLGNNTAGGGAPGTDSDYYREIQAWLERHKRYPRRSKLRNEQGVVLLRFVVTRDGVVTLSGIKKSSGHKRLDKEAMGMIKRAQPLPPMPDDMRQAQLDLVIPVKFHLQ